MGPQTACSVLFTYPVLTSMHLTVPTCCPRYIIPGGSAGRYEREGYIFDVGSSMMFGMGSEGTTNLITRALAAVGRSMETVPDPTQIHYRLPKSERHPQVSSNKARILTKRRAGFALPCTAGLEGNRQTLHNALVAGAGGQGMARLREVHCRADGALPA